MFVVDIIIKPTCIAVVNYMTLATNTHLEAPFSEPAHLGVISIIVRRFNQI